MEDEIDLQRYFLLLVDNWIRIIGAALVFAVVTALVSKFIISPTYRAKALVVITQPRYTLNFDPRFETDTNTDLTFFKPLAEIAQSDEMMEELLGVVSDLDGGEDLTLKHLINMTEVEVANPSSFVELFVKAEDPQMAAEVVNIWASLFVDKANEIFGENVDSSSVLNQQLDQAEKERTAAEQALVGFEAQNELTVYQSQLSIATNTYQKFLRTQSSLEQILQDVELLRKQLAVLPSSQEISLESELTVLLLQLKAFDVDQIPLQYQVDPQTPQTRRTVREMTTYLDSLSSALNTKISELVLELDPLNEEILALQSQIKVLESTSSRLQQDLQIAQDTHLTLARKVEETQISNQVSSTVKLASQASIPTDPVSPRTIINTLIAAVAGGLIGVFVIFLADFWKQASSDYAQKEQTAAKTSHA